MAAPRPRGRGCVCGSVERFGPGARTFAFRRVPRRILFPAHMKAKSKSRRTTVGRIDPEVLAFTAGRDIVLDLNLVEADCIGSAAHVTMLARMPVTPRLFTAAERDRVVAGLVDIIRLGQAGKFRITVEDQDVHLAVERRLTETLGDLGKRIHTGRSRNDQVALDLRLYAREELVGAQLEIAALIDALLAFARKHDRTPMVGRTHMQPAMPSSVGLWASSFAEGLLDDADLLRAAQAINDRSPLGAAASYGVPLPIDRGLVADLLGLAGPCHNVLYANSARGKVESIILAALAQAMLTLSRLAQDLLLFTMPEFGYFRLPDELCTGSSIMPQKRNADVCELVRAKASRVQACAEAAYGLVKGLPSGYNRDLQEAKEVFLEGFATTRASLRIMQRMIEGAGIHRDALLKGFTPDVFATDRALELVGQGMPFRDAYHHVKEHLDELCGMDAQAAVDRKRHAGAPAGLDYAMLARRGREVARGARATQVRYRRAIGRLLGVDYPVQPAA
jgi:argininosuccinate lyase